MKLSLSNPRAGLSQPAQRLFDDHARRIHRMCDRMFAGLFAIEWVGGILCALIFTPRTWIGSSGAIHLHVWASVILGAAIFSLPLYLIATHSGEAITRQTVAIAQMLYSALLIHLTGGRIETHFHIFGSLAFLAFYRDWRVLVMGSLVVTADHLLRGVFWSESVFGVAYASQWRWMEHAAWVLFEDVFLFMSCIQVRHEMAEIARRQADDAERSRVTTHHLKLALAEQVDLLTALDSGVIIATTDARGRILSANDGFCQISGYSREELIGKDHRIINSDFHPREFWANMFKTVHAGKVWRGEIRNRAKDGRLYWVDTTIKGVFNADGALQKIVAVRADITDRKTAQLQLQQAQKLESIGQLAAGIAHEINTPVQYVGDNVRFLEEQIANLMKVIKTYDAQLAPDARASTRAQRKAEIDEVLQSMDYAFIMAEIPGAIRQSIDGLDRVTTIVRAMKEFSHPGSDLMEPADLNRSIESTIEVCRNRWKYIAELETDLADDLPAVPCLVAEFNQVMLNLIVNACDAIAESAVRSSEHKGAIRITTRQVGDDVEIRVKDNGAGIPEAIKPRIFEQFFTSKPVGKGTGQGLALSRSIIVNKHGGSLTFESTHGVGTTFIVRLPLIKQDATDAIDTSDAIAA